MTYFVWDQELPLLRQLKSRKGIFCLPFNISMFLKLKDFLFSSSPPPGVVISNPLTGLCLAVASDVSSLDLLIFKFRSESFHKRSGNDADWLHKRTSWLLWYEQSWEMAGTWLFQSSWNQIWGQLQLYSCSSFWHLSMTKHHQSQSPSDRWLLKERSSMQVQAIALMRTQTMKTR